MQIKMNKWYLDFVPMLGENKYNLSTILAKMFQAGENIDEQKEKVKEV